MDDARAVPGDRVPAEPARRRHAADLDPGRRSTDDVTQVAANVKSVTMLLTVLPIICLYPFVQRYFVSGVMLGSVKQ